MMKHVIRDAFILLCSLTGVTAWYKKRFSKNKPLVRVLCFHDVEDGKWFSNIITGLKEEYHFVSPAEFGTREFSIDKINLLLTFDDGYKSWVDNVLPVLEEEGLKGIFFVASGLLNSAHNQAAVEKFMTEQLTISVRKPLSWEGAKQLLEAGQTIGGHTVTHVRANILNPGVFKEEVVTDRVAIYRETGVEPIHFAYPFGSKNDFNEDTHELIAEVGYQYCFSAEPGFYSGEGIVARTLIEDRQSLPSIRRWIDGGYDIFSVLKRILPI